MVSFGTECVQRASLNTIRRGLFREPSPVGLLGANPYHASNGLRTRIGVAAHPTMVQRLQFSFSGSAALFPESLNVHVFGPIVNGDVSVCLHPVVARCGGPKGSRHTGAKPPLCVMVHAFSRLEFFWYNFEKSLDIILM